MFGKYNKYKKAIGAELTFLNGKRLEYDREIREIKERVENLENKTKTDHRPGYFFGTYPFNHPNPAKAK